MGINNTKFEKEYVRSFLLYMKIGSPVARLNVFTKLLMVISISLIITRMISTERPDPLGITFFLAIIMVLLVLSGSLLFILRSRFSIIFFALFVIFLTWIIFNPMPGGRVLLRYVVFSGTLTLSNMVYLLIAVLISGVIYFKVKGFFPSLLTFIILMYGLNAFLPELPLKYGITLSGPFILLISEKSLLIAGTKVLGYGSMILATLLFLVTTRDIELVDLFRKLGFSFKYCFFLSLFFRTLSSALLDYTTIRQAQISRGTTLKKKNIFQVLRDFAMLSVPLIITTIRRGTEIGTALSARGFDFSPKKVTEFKESRGVSFNDYLLLLIFILLPVLILIFDVNVTELVLGEWLL
jgi:energy-coupling factor transport system permease protein